MDDRIRTMEGIDFSYEMRYNETSKFGCIFWRDFMNIAPVGNSSITLAVSDTGSMNAIDMAMLRKSLDSIEMNGSMITQMMEQSVNPNIGSNIDIRL